MNWGRLENNEMKIKIGFKETILIHKSTFSNESHAFPLYLFPLQRAKHVQIRIYLAYAFKTCSLTLRFSNVHRIYTFEFNISHVLSI